jgi:hypothetical protein
MKFPVIFIHINLKIVVLFLIECGVWKKLLWLPGSEGNKKKGLDPGSGGKKIGRIPDAGFGRNFYGSRIPG